MNWTSKQKDFLGFAINVNSYLGKQIFLTGKAGTGKTTVLREFIKIVSEQNVGVACLATTGVAAQLLKGQTLHSFFAVKPYNILTSTDAIFVRKQTRNIWNTAKIVIIDEASMLRPDQVDFINIQLLKNGCRPLTSKFLMFCGDFKQLPPIVDATAKAYLEEEYGNIDFRKAHCLSKIQTIELTEVMRQSDQEFIDGLNLVRDGQKANYFKEFIVPKESQSGVILCPYKKQVDRYNSHGLKNLPGDEIVLEGKISGDIKDDDFIIPPVIKVKHGAKVMICANDNERGLINGDLGTFEVEKNKFYFVNEKGSKFLLEPVESEKFKYILGNSKLELIKIGTMVQYPIIVAYALTIHKAQGQTFEDITIDASEGMFEKQQLYVALSRVSAPHGLKIILKN